MTEQLVQLWGCKEASEWSFHFVAQDHCFYMFLSVRERERRRERKGESRRQEKRAAAGGGGGGTSREACGQRRGWSRSLPLMFDVFCINENPQEGFYV